MKYLDLTLPTPEANLACDEALLDLCENGYPCPILRFWEPAAPFVVLGYANRLAEEVHVDHCQTDDIPILRRCSGGGTVLQGPGCLNYSLIVKITDGPPHHNITSTNQCIMETHRAALSRLLQEPVSIEGATDLAAGARKFSGNAQRRRRAFLLFHGTFLFQFDIGLIERVLRTPPKQPAYRHNRSHSDFVRNIQVGPNQLKETLRATWDAHDALETIPWSEIDQLVKQRYAAHAWTYKF